MHVQSDSTRKRVVATTKMKVTINRVRKMRMKTNRTKMKRMTTTKEMKTMTTRMMAPTNTRKAQAPMRTSIKV